MQDVLTRTLSRPAKLACAIKAQFTNRRMRIPKVLLRQEAKASC